MKLKIESLKLKYLKNIHDNMEFEAEKSSFQSSDLESEEYSFSYAEKVVNMFNLTRRIHDTNQRTRKIMLGMNLRVISNSRNDYCLICRKIVASKLENCLDHLRDKEHIEYLDSMEKSDNEIGPSSGGLSELALAQEFIEIATADTAQCVICFKEMANETCVLKEHMKEENHSNKWSEMRLRAIDKIKLIADQIQCDWYKVQKYKCIPCSRSYDFEIDFVNHLLCRHPEGFDRTETGDTGQIVLDFCQVCSLLWYTDFSVQVNHNSGFMHKWFTKNEQFTAPLLPEAAREFLVSVENYKNFKFADILSEIETQCALSITEAHEKGTGYNTEMNFEIELPIDNIQFLKFLNMICPICKKMMAFLSEWLAKCDLAGHEQISTITLYWCLIFYFQTLGILPSFVLLQSFKKFIPKLEIDKEDSSDLEETSLDFKQHLVGFFNLYASFDYRFNVACPLIGKVIQKIAFVEGTLPDEMKSYTLYINSVKYPVPIKVDSAMCLQDPFDLQNNITKFVKKINLCRFRTYCMKSLEVLRTLEAQNHPYLL